MANATLSLSDGHHGITFLPYARLAARHRVAGVEFLPLRTKTRRLSLALKSAHRPLRRILAGYTSRDGKRLDDCVVATIPGKGWDVDEADAEAINWAASLMSPTSAWDAPQPLT